MSNEAFTIRFTDMNAETGETFCLYETSEHGWPTQQDFIAHLNKYKTHPRVTDFFVTGYEELTENKMTKRRVEIA